MPTSNISFSGPSLPPTNLMWNGMDRALAAAFAQKAQSSRLSRRSYGRDGRDNNSTRQILKAQNESPIKVTKPKSASCRPSPQAMAHIPSQTELHGCQRSYQTLPNNRQRPSSWSSASVPQPSSFGCTLGANYPGFGYSQYPSQSFAAYPPIYGAALQQSAYQTQMFPQMQPLDIPNPACNSWAYQQPPYHPAGFCNNQATYPSQGFYMGNMMGTTFNQGCYMGSTTNMAVNQGFYPTNMMNMTMQEPNYNQNCLVDSSYGFTTQSSPVTTFSSQASDVCTFAHEMNNTKEDAPESWPEVEKEEDDDDEDEEDEEEGEELIGLGLYDPPEFSEEQIYFDQSGLMYTIDGGKIVPVMRKGLKLEETWEPPKKEDDGDGNGHESSEEEGKDEDEENETENIEEEEDDKDDAETEVAASSASQPSEMSTCLSSKGINTIPSQEYYMDPVSGLPSNDYYTINAAQVPSYNLHLT